MNTIAPHDDADRSLMWRLAGRWVRDRPAGGSGSRLIDSFLEPFNPIHEATLLQEARKMPPPFDLGPKLGWIQGRSLGEQASVPVATIQLENDDEGETTCCIRVGVFREREDCTISVEGWRFDSAETKGDALHPYQHAQAIIGWTISGTCLIHPTEACEPGCLGVDPTADGPIDSERVAALGRIDQSHPAFPFATRTLTGLVAAAMTTLYGARATRAIVLDESRLARANGAVGDDFVRLFG